MTHMKTNIEEIIGRLKTLTWNAFYIALAFVGDNLVSAMAGVSLPTITIDIFGNPTAVNTSIVAGLIIAQISKYIRNYTAGKVK